MVRQGVGVLVAVVVLAGCGGGGSSDEEKVAAVAKDFQSAANRHDGRALCHEVLHPNTVRAIERLAQAQVRAGGSPRTCEEQYRISRARVTPLDGRAAKPDEVTIKGDIAYVPDGEGGSKRALARRVDGEWKVDFTADPGLRWLMRSSLACSRWQDALQAMPLPTASREGIIAHLHAEADALASFLSGIDADAGQGEEQGAVREFTASLDRMTAELEGAAASLRRGRSLQRTTDKARKVLNEEGARLVRLIDVSRVDCGRIPAFAPDGAEFRRKANAVCAPISKRIGGLGDPGSSPRAAVRFLRRAGALERQASRRLAALTPPSDLDRVYRETLATVNGLGATLQAEGAAAARGDLAGARRAVGRLVLLDYRKSAGFARLGLASCWQL